MSDEAFWEHRLTAVKSKLIMAMVEYCDLYDILHSEVFNGNDVKTELVESIDKAVITFINDNYK